MNLRNVQQLFRTSLIHAQFNRLCHGKSEMRLRFYVSFHGAIRSTEVLQRPTVRNRVCICGSRKLERSVAQL